MGSILSRNRNKETGTATTSRKKKVSKNEPPAYNERNQMRNDKTDNK